MKQRSSLWGLRVRLVHNFFCKHFGGLQANLPTALRFHFGREFRAYVDDVLNALGSAFSEGLSDAGDGHQDVAVFDVVLADHSTGELKKCGLIATAGGGRDDRRYDRDGDGRRRARGREVQRWARRGGNGIVRKIPLRGAGSDLDIESFA